MDYMDTSDSEWSSEYEIDEDCNGLEDASLEDGNYLDDVVIPSTRKAPWDVITPDNIQQHQNESMAEVCDVLACPSAVARVLLMEYCWDKAHLINDYVEKGREVVFQRAGCSDGCNINPSEEVLTCECCFCSVERSDATAMTCGHWFCNECWLSHFEVQIKDGNSCRLKCMAFKCGCTCDEETVLNLLKNKPEIRDRYQHALLESYVNDNTNVKWCPSIPNCGNAIRNNRDDGCEPTCICGLHFCFTCLNEAHSPCTCDMWSIWERKRRDDSETMHWITAHTKPCPKCGKLVEKNGGCNLMTCRCGQHFCWLCGSATGFDHTYHTISNHECGRWKQELDKSIDAAASSHKRYIHYFSRWNGHRDSLKKEEANKEFMIRTLKNTCDALSGNDYEYNSLIAAVSVLLSARKVLSNSYAFAYFLCGNDWYTGEVNPEQTSLNQALFEDMQQQFEGEIERLSKLLSMTELELEDVKKKHLADVLTCARTTMKRMQNFYDAINSGLLGQLEQSVVSIADFMPHNLPI